MQYVWDPHSCSSAPNLAFSNVSWLSKCDNICPIPHARRLGAIKDTSPRSRSQMVTKFYIFHDLCSSLIYQLFSISTINKIACPSQPLLLMGYRSKLVFNCFLRCSAKVSRANFQEHPNLIIWTYHNLDITSKSHNSDKSHNLSPVFLWYIKARSTRYNHGAKFRKSPAFIRKQPHSFVSVLPMAAFML